MVAKSQEDLDLLEEARKEAEARYGRPGLPKMRFGAQEKSKARFGAKLSGLHDDRLSTKPVPAPKGPSAAELIEAAKRRRREREKEDGR